MRYEVEVYNVKRQRRESTVGGNTAQIILKIHANLPSVFQHQGT